MNKDEI